MLSLLAAVGLVSCGSGAGSAAQRHQRFMTATTHPAGSPTPDAASSRPARGGHAAGTPSAERNTPPVTPSTEGESTLAPDQPCPPLRPGRFSRSISTGGVTRSYLLAVPDAAGPRPVLVDYHGYQQSARQQEAYTGLAEVATRAGFVVLTPDGYAGQWNFVRRSSVGPDDVAFTLAMVTDAARVACLDQHQLAATGFSDGADMADTLACALPGRIVAVVPVAPSVFPAGCAAPTSYLEIHGTADPIVPYAGGGGDRPPPFQGTEAQPVAQRYAQWQQLAGCPAAVRSSLTPHVSLERSTCPGGREVSLLTVAGGGHTWPGAVGPPPAAGLGETSAEFSADDVIVQFIATHGA